ncbi:MULTISPECIES: DUF368 domain-containing protein [Tessaracoccus]|uniref:DUF368 domain-containing protein n=1 Tax=Tessaracoccus TaxID=72763 RepID=UPI00099C2D5D|nr:MULTISPECIES: DUF368 domain-containing protein [Tessaracoccus]AQX16259.1 DUF368 domain-containing protein [Tessaracoccus sp. T2.5-30]VEP40848.1 hypothetical protein TLA_TLA_02075 [Tessaracoccus lapidicaptus]
MAAPALHDSVIDRPESLRSWIGRLLKGVAVGVGAILPGLSGGVLAVIFGLYDPMIRFLADMRKRFWRNVAFFIPIALGMAIGIFAFSVLVKAAFDSYAAQFTCLFIGFVIGTFPSLYRQAGRHGRTSRHLVILGVAAAAIFLLMLAGGQMLVQVTPSIPVWFGSGALIGLGVIVPGMSPSNFLIYFGLYDKMAGGIKDGDLGVIIPLAVGVVVCVLLLARGAAWLFDRYYGAMYHLILGMVVGSSLAIFPTVVFPAFTDAGLTASGLTLPVAVLFAVAMLVVGAIASYLFSKVEDNVSDKRHEIDESANTPL